jgi:glycosyltransferase involved in cell wall biosynthesis
MPVIARNHPTAEITFVVPDEWVAAVTSRFGPAFGDRLVIRSWTSRERLMPIYNEHDILHFPSLFEGFGKVCLEGMAAGLCVVGFREGGLPDVALHGREALICDPGDSLAFQHLLSCALNNPERAEDIGQRARELARRFTWDRHAKETENFCWQLRLGIQKESLAS